MLFFSILVLLIPTASVALPQNIAVAQEGNVTRALPDTVSRNEKFNVTVTFITPIEADIVQLRKEYVPEGWSVQAKKKWCNPSVQTLQVTDNMVEAQWSTMSSYPPGTNISILYKVTVPVDASPGFHNFSEPEQGYIRYCLSVPPAPNWTYEDITGDSQVEVIVSEIYATPSSLAFGAVKGGLTPGNQTLVIWNSGDNGTALSWTLYDDADWLGENITSGNSTGVDDKTLVEVSVNITGLGVGDYSASITVTDPLAINSPYVVPVTLHIKSSSSSGGGGGGGGGGGPETLRGDVNEDEVVDELDLTLERGIILGLDGITENADCNGDGEIDARDITTIKRIILGME